MAFVSRSTRPDGTTGSGVALQVVVDIDLNGPLRFRYDQ